MSCPWLLHTPTVYSDRYGMVWYGMVRAYLGDVLLAPCTHRYKLGHVVSLTVELIILSIDSHSLQSSITHTAQEVVLMVQLLSSLHGAVSYLLIASAADHD